MRGPQAWAAASGFVALVLAAATLHGGARTALLGLRGRAPGDMMFENDSLRLRREQMVSELKRLRGVEGGMQQQMAQLENEERALKHAWQTTTVDTARQARRAHAKREGREVLSSSVFPAAFAGGRAGLSVCEPWPSCCPSGNVDNCFGVVSGGVLGAHACSPYPMCCGGDTHNCFDEASMSVTPDDSAAAPSQLDIQQLAAVCEGEEQLKQCLVQTQRCMTPDSEGRAAGTCTCFSSSLYCSYPQTPEHCSPCPMACQQHIYDWFKETQTEMDGSAMQCPLFEKPTPDEDISALDDGSFRPFAWFSNKELAGPPPKVIPGAKSPVETPPIHVKWPEIEDYHFKYLSPPHYYHWYTPRPLSKPAPSYQPHHRPHADRPKVLLCMTTGNCTLACGAKDSAPSANCLCGHV
jgi:hypothetical protein